MITIYYRDAIEQEDLIINDETFLYLVQCNDAQEFALKAIKKVHLDKIHFDPHTRALQYWPINLALILALENNEEARSKILYCEHDSQRLVLSSSSLTRREVKHLLKIDPILDNSEGDTSESNASVAKIHSIHFNSNSSSSAEEFISLGSFIRFVEINIMNEHITFVNRLDKLMSDAKLVHILCDRADSSQRLNFILTLRLIKNECEEIKKQIDICGMTLCLLSNEYQYNITEEAFSFLISGRKLSHEICVAIDSICVQYQRSVDNSSLQQPASFFYHPHRIIEDRLVLGCDPSPGSAVGLDGRTVVPSNKPQDTDAQANDQEISALQEVSRQNSFHLHMNTLENDKNSVTLNQDLNNNSAINSTTAQTLAPGKSEGISERGMCAIINYCINTFFKSVTPAEASYPYNRTRVRL